jgi:hypothetical protein
MDHVFAFRMVELPSPSDIYGHIGMYSYFAAPALKRFKVLHASGTQQHAIVPRSRIQAICLRSAHTFKPRALDSPATTNDNVSQTARAMCMRAAKAAHNLTR